MNPPTRKRGESVKGVRGLDGEKRACKIEIDKIIVINDTGSWNVVIIVI